MKQSVENWRSSGNRLRRAVLAVFLAVSVSAAGCAGILGGFNLISIEEEWELGAQLERDIAQELPIVNDAQLNQYITQMGQRIVAETEMAHLPWNFHVVADANINAFNIPGGHVYVYTGLITAANNAAELAGVVAHEIAHGVARHGTQRLSQAYGMNVLAAVILGQDPALYQQILAQVLAGGAFAQFSQRDEREADRLGVRFMYEAGYDPEGMARMFEQLVEERERRPGALEQFFSTHPLTENRIRDVRIQADRLPERNLRMNERGFEAAQQRAARHG